MIICDENNTPIKLNGVEDEIESEYFWTLDLQEQDWFLSKICLLEESYKRVLSVSFGGKVLDIPADWNILVYSKETSEVDMVEVSDLTRTTFNILFYNPEEHSVTDLPVKVVNYKQWEKVCYPSINRNTMLCCDVGGVWIMIAPTDTYNKFLKKIVTVGNFLNI